MMRLEMLWWRMGVGERTLSICFESQGCYPIMLYYESFINWMNDLINCGSSLNQGILKQKINHKFFYLLQLMSFYPNNPQLQSPLQWQHVQLSQDKQPLLYSNKKLQNMNCIIEKSSELGGLYLGDIISTVKEDLLKYHKIASVLTCLGDNQCRINYSIVQNHMVIPARDIVEYPIINHFEEALAYIEAMRKEGKNVLVHCHAGVSRSATIVCAYLMTKNSWNPDQAYVLVKSKRDRARPNLGFMNQLWDFYHSKINKSIQNTHQKQQLEDQSLSPFKKDNSIRSPIKSKVQKKDQSLNASRIHKLSPSKRSRRRRIFDNNQLLSKPESFIENPNKIPFVSQCKEYKTPVKQTNSYLRSPETNFTENPSSIQFSTPNNHTASTSKPLESNHQRYQSSIKPPSNRFYTQSSPIRQQPMSESRHVRLSMYNSQCMSPLGLQLNRPSAK